MYWIRVSKTSCSFCSAPLLQDLPIQHAAGLWCFTPGLSFLALTCHRGMKMYTIISNCLMWKARKSKKIWRWGKKDLTASRGHVRTGNTAQKKGNKFLKGFELCELCHEFNSLILSIEKIIKKNPTKKTNQARIPAILTDSFSSEWKFPTLQWDVVTGKSKY